MVDTYAHPTRANRIKVIAVVGAWALAFMLFGKIWIPIAQPHLNAGGCAALPWMYASGAIVSVLLLIPAIAYARGALLTAIARVSPFPGAWVVVRVPTRTGFWAIFDAVFQGMLSTALTLAIGCIWYFFFYACGPSLSCGC
jgi:hypothetical protein